MAIGHSYKLMQLDSDLLAQAVLLSTLKAMNKPVVEFGEEELKNKICEGSKFNWEEVKKTSDRILEFVINFDSNHPN